MEPDRRARGSLRIYLGAAPGVGKTYSMLAEAHRRVARGSDVVVAYLEAHGRANTSAQLRGLEVVPRRTLAHRGTAVEEMDVDAVLARRPSIALVDELAHTNAPGARNAKRWQDVEELVAAGIDVVTTLNVQHLESLNDVVERITGVRQQETVPDHVVRSADQVELIDMTPEALRRRMAHGNVYGPETVDSALANYFRPGNLAALRELALLWLADQVDSGLEGYREHHGITDPWETRERVVVSVTGAPGSENLIRRGARIARRTRAELLGVHVRQQDGLMAPPFEDLAEHRRLVEALGGAYHEVASADVALALVEFARAENATQLIVGASRRGRWRDLLGGSIVNRVVRLSGPIDVHVISPESTEPPGTASPVRRLAPRGRTPPAPRRRAAAWALALLGLPLVTVLLVGLRDHLALGGVLLLYVLMVVAVAVLGGLAPAVVAAVGGFLLGNWYFTPPLHRFSIGENENMLALLVYLVVAVVVSSLVAVARRRTAESSRATAEAETLASLAGQLVDSDPLPLLMIQMRRAFGLEGVALLRRSGDGWLQEAADGAAPSTPEEADATERLDDELLLVVRGGALAADDRRVLNAFAAHLGAALERRRLRHEAANAASLAEANALRAALLQAVSHDLRTPLAGIKASVSSLRQRDVAWTEEQQDEFEATIEEETDRLTKLVGDLLDMSRIQADAVRPEMRAVALDEVVPAALHSLGARANRVRVDVADNLPAVSADPGLLERVVANLVDNAIVHTRPGTAVRVEAGEVNGEVHLRVIDRGTGIESTQREQAFEPFQRLGDAGRTSGTGVGLGLAVARGFTRAIGGDLAIDDTPGGGTTMVVTLRPATASRTVPQVARR
jgi:two-component system sensor histidine kinase KdpD